MERMYKRVEIVEWNYETKVRGWRDIAKEWKKWRGNIKEWKEWRGNIKEEERI
jgi:hypothetical protein